MTNLGEILAKKWERDRTHIKELHSLPKLLESYKEILRELFVLIKKLNNFLDLRIYRLSHQDLSKEVLISALREEEKALDELKNFLSRIEYLAPLDLRVNDESNLAWRVVKQKVEVRVETSTFYDETSTNSRYERDWRSDLEEALSSYGRTLYPFSAESQIIDQLKSLNERLSNVDNTLRKIQERD